MFQAPFIISQLQKWMKLSFFSCVPKLSFVYKALVFSCQIIFSADDNIDEYELEIFPPP